MKLGKTQSIEKQYINGYEAYRIPGIIATDKGTVIVYYEARHGCDWGVIDLYAMRSADGGATWQERQLLLSGRGKNTTNNPCMIADGDRIHLLCLENYKRLFHMVSTDEGATWSAPREITGALEARRDEYPWTCAAVGPGHGIKLRNGRLIAPVWLASNPANITTHWPSRISTLYSDDGGDNWQLGDIFEPEGSCNPNETCISELSDGRVLANVRCMRHPGETANIPHYRMLTVSDDGVSGWKEDRFDTQLPDPVCCGGMCTYPGGLLFTNCATSLTRSLLTLRTSRNDGRTWSEGIMYEALGGYSDCAYDPMTGKAFTFYEYERESELRLSSFTL